MTDVVESVDQFPPGMRIENRQGLFDLDPSPDGWFYQCWVIDRVMGKGGFWTARLQDLKPQASDENEALGPSEQEQTDASDVEISTDRASLPRSIHLGHANLMFTAAMLRMMAEQVRYINKGEDIPSKGREAVRSHITTAPQALSSFAVAVAKAQDQNHLNALH